MSDFLRQLKKYCGAVYFFLRFLQINDKHFGLKDRI